MSGKEAWLNAQINPTPSLLSLLGYSTPYNYNRKPLKEAYAQTSSLVWTIPFYIVDIQVVSSRVDDSLSILIRKWVMQSFHIFTCCPTYSYVTISNFITLPYRMLHRRRYRRGRWSTLPMKVIPTHQLPTSFPIYYFTRASMQRNNGMDCDRWITQLSALQRSRRKYQNYDTLPIDFPYTRHTDVTFISIVLLRNEIYG